MSGAFLKKVEWTSDSGTEEMTDVKTISISKSTEIKNNICTVTLRNPYNRISNDGTTVIGKYVSPTTHEIMFSEEDEVQVYALSTDDPTDFEGIDWAASANSQGNFILESFSVSSVEGHNEIVVKAIDIAYHLFNKVWTYSYGVNNDFTVPGIIKHICKYHTEASERNSTTYNGTQNDSGVLYISDSKFVSEGGYIEDYRRIRTGTNPDTYSYDATTALDGALNDSDTTISVDDTTGFESIGTLVIDTEHIAYTGISGNDFTGCTRGIDDTEAASHSDNADVYQGFPLTVISKIWKPLFEWVGELSQTQYTNHTSEITEGGTLYFNRAFMFWVDKDNKPHFFYPDDEVDLTVELGEEGRRGFKLEKSVFDAVNMVIYNSGEDMYGNGIIYYVYDETSDVGSLKMRYQPMTKIVETLVNKDISDYNTSRKTDPSNDRLKQFPTDVSYNITSWGFKEESNKFRALQGDSARTQLTSDSDYNESLREAAKWVGRSEALKITRKRSGLRYKGQIIIRNASTNPGDLIQVTNPATGQVDQLLRVLRVDQRINKGVWESTLQVEEDEKVA